MTWLNKRTVAYRLMLGSVGLNTGIVVGDLVVRQWAGAAHQSIVVALLGTWFWLVPKVDAWLDAQLAEAEANQRTAEMASAEFARLQRRGELQVGVTMQARPLERMH